MRAARSCRIVSDMVSQYARIKERVDRSVGASVLLFCIVAALYATATLFGLRIMLVNLEATTVWIPTGIAFATLLFFGYRYAPAIFVGTFVANYLTFGIVQNAVGIAFGNTVEAIIFTAIARRFAGGTSVFESGVNILKFSIFAAGIATAVNAAYGASVVALMHFVPWSNVPLMWTTWWLGNWNGALIVTPLLALWSTRPPQLRSRSLVPEVFAWLLLYMLMFVVLGSRPLPEGYAMAFLAIPFLVWAVFRFGAAITMSGVLLLSLLSLPGILLNTHVLPGYEPNMNVTLLLLQAFITVTAFTFLILAVEVAERLHLVEALGKRADSLAITDQRKNEFIAILAHELRNPLAPVRTAVEFLRLKNISDPAIAEAINIIDRQVGSFTRLLGDLLDVSRATHGKIELRPEEADLRLTVIHATAVADALIKKTGNALVADLPQQSVTLTFDPMRIEQIVVNLLNNAAKYTPSGGKIMLQLRENEDDIEIIVRDNGIGIAAEDIPHVFDLFGQVNKEQANTRGGLGVGLMLAKNIAKLHGGNLTVSSGGPGEGSEFVLHLPKESPLRKPAPVPTVKAGTRAAGEDVNGRKRVLIIDDNVDAANAMRTGMIQLGHSASVAHDGHSGVAEARSFRPDVILLDIGMPGMDGYAVARELRADRVFAGVQLIALTGYGQEEDKEKTKQAGFNAHLTKPVSLFEVLKLIDDGPTHE